MNAGDPGRGHKFSFGHGGDADADGSRGDLALGDLRALVRLRVGTEMLAGGLHFFGHAREVGIERVEVEEQRRSGQFVNRSEHLLMIARDTLREAFTRCFS